MAAIALTPQMFGLDGLETSNMVVKSLCPNQGPRQRAKSQRCGGTSCHMQAPMTPCQPRSGSCGPRGAGGRAAAQRARAAGSVRGLSRDKKRVPHVRRTPPGSTLSASAATLEDSYGALVKAAGEVFAEAVSEAVPEEAPMVEEADPDEAPVVEEADSEVEFREGVNSCASNFIMSLLEDAVEEYTDEAVREIVYPTDAMLVMSEAEPTILEDTESFHDEDIIPQADALLEKVPLSQAATDMEDLFQDDFLDHYMEEELSVVSYAGDRGYDLEEEEENAAADFAGYIVHTGFHALSIQTAPTISAPQLEVAAVRQAAEFWPSAEMLEPCTRRGFRRRLAPRQPGAPVPEEPFPGDCWPLSRPVAREVPPSAEIAALPMRCPGEVREASQPLSKEAEDRLCSIAASAFAALRLMASEEASGSIKRAWKAYKARRILAKSKTALAAASPVAPQAAPPAVAAPQQPRGTASMRRRIRVPASTPIMLSGDSEASAPVPPAPIAGPGVVEPRPPTSPLSARAGRAGSRLSNALAFGNEASSMVPPVLLPRAETPAPPAGAPSAAGCRSSQGHVKVGPGEGGSKTPRTARPHYVSKSKTAGFSLEGPKSARAPSSTASPTDSVWAQLLSGDGSTWDATPLSSRTEVACGAFRRRKASVSTPPGNFSSGTAGEAGGATPRTTGLSAMELDLGCGPAAPSSRVFVPESPRNKSGTGLLPALHSKAFKAGAVGSMSWTIDQSGSLSARGGSLSARGAAKSIDATGPLI
uniref:Uncharacterized protein n=1 Tax=Alexandrium monilatum TaxID=311494 RepID=A0A7S4VII7_9DINO